MRVEETQLVNEIDIPMSIAKILMSKTISYRNYKLAVNALRDVINSATIGGKTRHGLEYYAAQVARSYDKMDARTLTDLYRKQFDESVINEVTPQEHMVLNLTNWDGWQDVEKYLHEQGFEVLGQGAFSAVWAREGSDKVIKLSFGEDKCWLRYAQWVLEQPKNKHLPNIYSLREYDTVQQSDDDAKSKRMFISVLERLTEAQNYHDMARDIIKYSDNPMKVAEGLWMELLGRRKGNDRAKAMYLQKFWHGSVLSKQAPWNSMMVNDAILGILEKYDKTKLVRTIDTLNSEITGANACYPDLHRGNIMMRGDTIVIMDPVAYDNSFSSNNQNARVEPIASDDPLAIPKDSKDSGGFRNLPGDGPGYDDVDWTNAPDIREARKELNDAEFEVHSIKIKMKNYLDNKADHNTAHNQVERSRLKKEWTIAVDDVSKAKKKLGDLKVKYNMKKRGGVGEANEDLTEVSTQERLTFNVKKWESLKQLRDYLRSKKFEKIGSGVYAEAWQRLGSNQVVKISRQEDECWLGYAKWVQKQPPNPHLPVISSLRSYMIPIRGVETEMFISVMESLTEIDARFTKSYQLIAKSPDPKIVAEALWILSLDEVPNSNVFIEAMLKTMTRRHAVVFDDPRFAGKDPASVIRFLLGTFKRTSLVQTVKRADAVIAKMKACTSDLHSGNIMLRGNTIVVIDPAAYKSE